MPQITEGLANWLREQRERRSGRSQPSMIAFHFPKSPKITYRETYVIQVRKRGRGHKKWTTTHMGKGKYDSKKEAEIEAKRLRSNRVFSAHNLFRVKLKSRIKIKAKKYQPVEGPRRVKPEKKKGEFLGGVRYYIAGTLKPKRRIKRKAKRKGRKRG